MRTAYSPFTSEKSTTLVYTHDGHEEYAQEYPMCSAALSAPCFDLSRCGSSMDGDGALKVFSHGGDVDKYLDHAAKQRPESIQRVHNASNACLLVVGINAYENPHDLLHSPDWNHGKNHYVFDHAPTLFVPYGEHGDRPFNAATGFGMAAVARNSVDDAYYREGYDTALALVPQWQRPKNFDRLDVHRPRKYLISFKGNIYPWEQRSWQHRWIAAEYWYEEPDVHVDTKCESAKDVIEEYENEGSGGDYGNLLLNSTFFFCPGGGGVNSFRFSESLLAGAIPVVTSDFVPPFHPDIDWSNCIVRVSEARVVDVPRLVREISEEEVRTRQRRCAALANAVFGNPPEPVRQLFSMAMQVWSVRVKNALRRRDGLEALIG